MNIFILSRNPYVSATYMCDKHIPKMIIESAQMLASALRRHGARDGEMPLTQKGTPFGNAFPNHPCTRWVGDNKMNFTWLLHHAYALLDQYKLRYGKNHATGTAIRWMGNMDALLPWGNNNYDFALAMPDQYKRKCPVESYRLYYRTEKARFAKWEKGVPKPYWFDMQEVA